MKITVIGYNHDHDGTFVMDRPDGPGAWLFLLIKTDAVFFINNTESRVKAGSAVLFRPDTPIRYTAAENRYTDDWFYFETEDGDEQHILSLGIPVDRPFHIGSIEELSSVLHVMTFEHYSAEPYHSEIEQGYLDIFWLRLARSISGSRSSADLSDRDSRMTLIRTRIYTRPDEIGSIDSLAEESGMSRSGFQHLYRRMFGANVMSDIIEGRLQKARRLLTSTELTIEQIAVSCGYSDGGAFMRQFRLKCGMTPTQFRKRMLPFYHTDGTVGNKD